MAWIAISPKQQNGSNNPSKPRKNYPTSPDFTFLKTFWN
jgi:hypothetical protein